MRADTHFCSAIILYPYVLESTVVNNKNFCSYYAADFNEGNCCSII